MNIVSEDSVNSILLVIAVTIANAGVKLVETNVWDDILKGIGVLVVSVILLVLRAYLQKQGIVAGVKGLVK